MCWCLWIVWRWGSRLSLLIDLGFQFLWNSGDLFVTQPRLGISLPYLCLQSNGLLGSILSLQSYLSASGDPSSLICIHCVNCGCLAFGQGSVRLGEMANSFSALPLVFRSYSSLLLLLGKAQCAAPPTPPPPRIYLSNHILLSTPTPYIQWMS